MKMYLLTLITTLGLLTAGLANASTVEGRITNGKILKTQRMGDKTSVTLLIEMPVCHAKILNELDVHVNYQDSAAYITVAGEYEYENKDIHCVTNGSKLINIELDQLVNSESIFLGFEK